MPHLLDTPRPLDTPAGLHVHFAPLADAPPTVADRAAFHDRAVRVDGGPKPPPRTFHDAVPTIPREAAASACVHGGHPGVLYWRGRERWIVQRGATAANTRALYYVVGAHGTLDLDYPLALAGRW
jgi:hypothetical protein